MKNRNTKAITLLKARIVKVKIYSQDLYGLLIIMKSFVRSRMPMSTAKFITKCMKISLLLMFCEEIRSASIARRISTRESSKIVNNIALKMQSMMNSTVMQQCIQGGKP